MVCCPCFISVSTYMIPIFFFIWYQFLEPLFSKYYSSMPATLVDEEKRNKEKDGTCCSSCGDDDDDDMSKKEK